jgi:hypothetical protein
MIRPLGLALALVIAGSASPAHAGTGANVKCALNEDRVWVYENLDDFNLAAKLKCGDPVQVESRVKGYVKIQTADGTEGYVLDSALPKSALPPAPEEKPITVEAASLAFAAKRAGRSATPTVSSAPTASPAPTAVAASSAPAIAVTSASTAPVAVAARTAPGAPAASASAAPAAAPAAAQPVVAVSAPTPAPAPARSSVAPAPLPAAPAPAPVYVSQPASSPATAPAAASAPTITNASRIEVETVSAPPQPAPPAPTVAAKYSNPQPIALARAKKHKTPQPAPTEPAVSATQPTVVAEAAPAPPPPSVAKSFAATPQPQPATSASPTVTSNVQPNENAAMSDNSASIRPVSSPADPPAPARAIEPPVNPDDDDDTAVHQLAADTANCTHYFSAYGLSPNQYKWLAQNRHKAFPSVCPAPTPAMVDFVVIFTHDVAFYNVTMPDAIHVEQNGFSDWTPLTTVDTALMTPEEADKSHHEYVWVFHTTRGAFDPSKFSSHRRPLYSKAETNTLGSRGGFRTVMDALTFIEQSGTNR